MEVFEPAIDNLIVLDSYIEDNSLVFRESLEKINLLKIE